MDKPGYIGGRRDHISQSVNGSPCAHEPRLVVVVVLVINVEYRR